MIGKISLEGRQGSIDVFAVEVRRVAGSLPGFTKRVGSFKLPTDKTGTALRELDECIKTHKIMHLVLDDGTRYEVIVKLDPLVAFSSLPIPFVINDSVASS